MNKITSTVTIKNKIQGKIFSTKVYPELEDIVITPTIEEQHFKSKKYGFENITVKAVENVPSDINIKVEGNTLVVDGASVEGGVLIL